MEIARLVVDVAGVVVLILIYNLLLPIIGPGDRPEEETLVSPSDLMEDGD